MMGPLVQSLPRFPDLHTNIRGKQAPDKGLDHILTSSPRYVGLVSYVSELLPRRIDPSVDQTCKKQLSEFTVRLA
ncbi:protein of unknown function [Nitrospira japonica]|uniref:Uncharacterized protein n=1 Tax=Nitrospira japonica TaxID=1325564 RepID=A0A1W1I7N3_9BACT|nr:protein of unknown function [Nitrospira japonica]